MKTNLKDKQSSQVTVKIEIMSDAFHRETKWRFITNSVSTRVTFRSLFNNLKLCKENAVCKQSLGQTLPFKNLRDFGEIFHDADYYWIFESNYFFLVLRSDIHMHIYIHILLHTHIWVCLCVCVCVGVCMWVCVSVFKCWILYPKIWLP